MPEGRLRELASRTKSFDHRWVGDRRLNRIGLHPARIAIADLLTRVRRGQSGGAPVADLARDGVAVLRGFLPDDRAGAIRAEARGLIDRSIAAVPLPRGGVAGFGAKQPFAGGFDRLDGSTLNRFLEVSHERTPAIAALARDPDFAALCAWASSYRHRPGKLSIYLTVQGDEVGFHDIQKDLHRDTFHSAIKLWYFVEPVADAAGPFEYVPGSHRMTAARYRWEYRRSLAARDLDPESRAGSFRVDLGELAGLGLPQPRRYPVPANTLVIADVRGFHRRGEGSPGAQRLCLYANLRPHPFSPVPR